MVSSGQRFLTLVNTGKSFCRVGPLVIGLCILILPGTLGEPVTEIVPVAQFAAPALGAESSPFSPLPEPEAPSTPVGHTGGTSPPKTTAPNVLPQDGTRGQSPSTAAQSGASVEIEREAKTSSSSLSFWRIVRAGGTVGFLIILLSIVAVALAVEHLLTLRRDLFMPLGLIEEVSAKLSAKDWNGAAEACRAHPSVLAHILISGISEHGAGWNEMEKVMEETLAEQTARWNRKVEYLSVIGNIAPMLGLLGTVIGMILAFRTVAETQGAARAADLAEAIYLALVTTVEGLIVAIPSLAAYAFFRNRVDELMAEVAATVQKIFAPLKRRRAVAPAPAPPSAGASH